MMTASIRLYRVAETRPLNAGYVPEPVFELIARRGDQPANPRDLDIIH